MSQSSSQPPEQKPAWSQEDAVAYEVARECITRMMAIRTSWIAEEQRQAEPNPAKLEVWRRERFQYATELADLDVRDRMKSERICEFYGAQIRALQGNVVSGDGRSRQGPST
jgi:hypothetical protein